MSLFSHRIRGFRLVDLVAFGVLIALIVGVYLAKTFAGGERAEIATVERQIVAERARIRLLQAEVSHLEQPSRISHLSEAYLGLKPAAIDKETTVDELTVVLRAQAQAEAAKAAAEAAKAAAQRPINAPVAVEFQVPSTPHRPGLIPVVAHATPVGGGEGSP